MKISVLTPSFNSGKYIERAIESVLLQNYDDFEHIITDGGSTDDTISIVEKYPHIKFVSEADKGQSDAMNKAFKMSSGEIIVYLNADDEFLPGVFNTVNGEFSSNGSADMVVGNLLFKTDEETLTRIPSNKYSHIFQYWLNVFPNNPVSYFYKRKVQESIGDFPIDDHFAMDLWFLLKAYRKFNIHKVESIFGIFHSDGTNKTATIETGYYLHNTVKNHLKKDNPFLLPYFYFKLFLGKLKQSKI